MDEVKNELPIMLMIGILILIFVLVFACGIIAYLYLSPAPDGGLTQPPEPDGGTSPGGVQNNTIELNTTETNISGDDMALWDSITLPNVEAACLIKAREEAGASADFVYNCDCDETASPLQKSYVCTINTADPFTLYFANIDCFLDESICSVETNYGINNVSFTELRDLYEE